jgi:hypothetical protein
VVALICASRKCCAWEARPCRLVMDLFCPCLHQRSGYGAARVVGSSLPTDCKRGVGSDFIRGSSTSGVGLFWTSVSGLWARFQGSF